MRGAVAAVGKRNLDARGVVDYMAVGKDETVGREDESGASAVTLGFPGDFDLGH